MNRHSLAISLASSLLLTGCLGGGGGGSKPTSDKGVHEPGVGNSETGRNEPRRLENGLLTARVAVVDTGYDLEAFAEDKVVGTLNVWTQTEDVSSGDTRHGTLVASVVANDARGNAELDLIQVTDTDTAWESALNHGVGQAADRGARAINVSFSGRTQLPHPSLTFNDVNSLTSLEKIVSSNDGRGSVYVVSAGNDGQPLATGERPVYTHADLYSRMLIVGGSRDSGNALHPASTHPGENAEWQRRFLTAPYEWPELDGGVAGTSFSAPQVAAYAASINGQWPHLSAQQVSQLLLDTASQHSPLYSRTDCGTSESLNCGFYYLGQGEADIDAATAPSGSLNVPSGETVGDGGVAPAQSAARLSGAYGDALAASGVFSEVMALDTLGRDYRIDMSSHLVADNRYVDDRRMAMARTSLASPEGRHKVQGRFGAFGFAGRQDGDGNIHMARFDADTDVLAWSAYQYSGDEVDPVSGYAESGMMPLLSFQAGSDLTRQLDTVLGARAQYAFGDELALVASHWRGNADYAVSGPFDGYRADRADVGLRYALNERLSLTPSVGLMTERHGLLGAQGAGSLELGDTNRTTFASLRSDYRIGDRLTAFAHYDRGQGKAEGEGMIQRIDGLRADAMAFGMQWSGKSHQAALALRQPLRMDAATATVAVPVGRTLAGEVLRETRHFDLTPSGRQQDIEFGYALQPSERSRVQINLLYTLEPGHDRKAPTDAAAMLNYQYDF